MTTAMTTSQLFRPQQQFNKGKYGRGKESCVPLYFFFLGFAHFGIRAV